MLTIPTSRPWVPLRILGLGLDKSRIINADVFLLTDRRPNLLAGGSGLTLGRDEQANPSLLSDLRIDKGMSWVPAHMWFTYLRLQVAAGQLDYDLAVSVKPHSVPSLTDAGVTAGGAHVVRANTDGRVWPLGIAGGVGIATLAVGGLFGRRRRTYSGRRHESLGSGRGRDHAGGRDRAHRLRGERRRACDSAVCRRQLPVPGS